MDRASTARTQRRVLSHSRMISTQMAQQRTVGAVLITQNDVLKFRNLGGCGSSGRFAVWCAPSKWGFGPGGPLGLPRLETKCHTFSPRSRCLTGFVAGCAQGAGPPHSDSVLGSRGHTRLWPRAKSGGPTALAELEQHVRGRCPSARSPLKARITPVFGPVTPISLDGVLFSSSVRVAWC